MDWVMNGVLILVFVAVYFIGGVFILALVDNDDGRLFQWIEMAPFHGLAIMVAALWPVVLSIRIASWQK